MLRPKVYLALAGRKPAKGCIAGKTANDKAGSGSLLGTVRGTPCRSAICFCDDGGADTAKNKRQIGYLHNAGVGNKTNKTAIKWGRKKRGKISPPWSMGCCIG